MFAVKLPEDDLKKIETCRSISELYVKALTVKLFINAGVWMQLRSEKGLEGSVSGIIWGIYSGICLGKVRQTAARMVSVVAGIGAAVLTNRNQKHYRWPLLRYPAMHVDAFWGQ